MGLAVLRLGLTALAEHYGLTNHKKRTYRNARSQNTLRLPIPDDACAKARVAAGSVNPDTVLEFVRGTLWVPCDVVCLRGTVRAFASRTVNEGPNGLRHVQNSSPSRRTDNSLRVRPSVTGALNGGGC